MSWCVSRVSAALRSPVVRRLLSESSSNSRKYMDGLVKKDKVVVFMKGTPAQPLCGFSNAVVQILRMHGVDEYAAYNVLEDQDLRQVSQAGDTTIICHVAYFSYNTKHSHYTMYGEVLGVKNYSNWPTIPQVFLNGEFVGGCDILLQMHQNGDLVEELKKLGIRSALLDAEPSQEKK